MLAVLLVLPAPASPRGDQSRSGPAPGDPDPEVPTLVARVFFAAEDGANGRELWRADITEDIVPLPPVLNTPTSALVVGATNTLTGSRITPGTVVKLFVATASGPVAYGPYTPSGTTTGSITFAIPASVPLGNGFVAVQVVATDVGYLESNVVGALLYGDAADGIPTILTINGQALAAPDLSIGLAHADTVVGKGATVTITGTGFSSPLVNLFTATGNVGPLTPLGGGTSTSIQVQIPAGAPTGPGNFQVVNRPSFTTGNAVASIIGARPAITSVSVSGATVTVNGAGFSVISVINLFNLQGGSVVNLGGYGPGGVAQVPLTLVNDTRFTFTRPAGAAAGQAFVEVLNPPYTPFSSSGSDPDGAFSFPPAPLILTDAVPAHSGERPAGSTAEAADRAAGGEDRLIGVNVLLNTRITPALVQELGAYGRVRDQLVQISAVTMQARAADLPLIARLPFVEAANPDVGRTGRPIDSVPHADFEDGLSTWNLDAVNVTDIGADNRQVPYDGAGVYVAVLDTGLLDSWRQYFPQERIAVRYARAFGGGGGLAGWVSSQPNKWEHDQDSHGTHVASTIIGYSLRGAAVNGVAPQATIIPVKVLNQNGSGWSSVVARGVMYVAELKRGPLAAHPVVINMSLGGATLDAVEQAAIDYAVANGVVIVASAGNAGQAGMGFPGAYAPVISVAASGWTGEWVGPASWWSASDVGDPAVEGDFYVTSFSSRARPGQDLDVAAPGSWVVGPYQVQSGRTSYYFLGGTSMASPHVAGIVALMLQKNPGQGASLVESRLEAAAIPLAPGCRNVTGPSGTVREVCWGADATGAGLITADAALAAVP
jgi:subtilisin family serine protease